MSDDARIIGVGLHPFGRFPDLSYRELGDVALRAALADAGIDYGEVDAVLVGNVLAPMAKATNVVEHVGLTGVPTIAVENACASGGSALLMASQLVRAGVYGTVVALGVEKAQRGFIPDCGYLDWQIESGLGANPVYFALGAKRAIEEWGITEEQLAQVSVKNHDNGVHNPNAMYRKAVTRDEVLASPMVCDPLRLLMLCAPNEGAAAVVVTSAERARRRGTARAVRVRSVSLSSRLAGQFFVPAAAGTPTVDGDSSARRAARDAFERAGIGPDEIDVFEVQDTDAASELIAYGDLGICAPEQAGSLLDSGATEIGGARPVNPSGGLLSKGEPLGASGIGQVVELVTQLRGEAGPRQVEKPRTALGHVIGAGANVAVTILSV